jgi:hypothetical protein
MMAVLGIEPFCFIVTMENRKEKKMEEVPSYEPEAPAANGKMAPWLIVVLVILGLCCLLVVASVCVIGVLTLLGPAVGNVFSDITTSI